MTEGKTYEFQRFTIGDGPLAVGCVLPPSLYVEGDYATGVISGYLSMTRYEKVTYLILGGLCGPVENGAALLKIEVLESIGGVPDGNLLKSIVVEECGIGCGINDLWVIQIEASELDVNNGYSHLELLISVIGETASWELGAVAIRSDRDINVVPLDGITQLID